MIEADGINQIPPITFLNSCGLNRLCIHANDWGVVIKDLTNAFKIANFEDGGFCGLNFGVIHHWDGGCETANPFRNCDLPVFEFDICTTEDNIAGTIEVVNTSGDARASCGVTSD